MLRVINFMYVCSIESYFDNLAKQAFSVTDVSRTVHRTDFNFTFLWLLLLAFFHCCVELGTEARSYQWNGDMTTIQILTECLFISQTYLSCDIYIKLCYVTEMWSNSPTADTCHVYGTFWNTPVIKSLYVSPRTVGCYKIYVNDFWAFVWWLDCFNSLRDLIIQFIEHSVYAEWNWWICWWCSMPQNFF